jgi:hypothetical protein
MYRYATVNYNNWEEVPEAPYTFVKDNLPHLLNLPVMLAQGIIFIVETYSEFHNNYYLLYKYDK